MRHALTTGRMTRRNFKHEIECINVAQITRHQQVGNISVAVESGNYSHYVISSMCRRRSYNVPELRWKKYEND